MSECIREKGVGRDREQSVLFVSVEALVNAEFIEIFDELKVLREEGVLFGYHAWYCKVAYARATMCIQEVIILIKTDGAVVGIS